MPLSCAKPSNHIPVNHEPSSVDQETAWLTLQHALVSVWRNWTLHRSYPANLMATPSKGCPMMVYSHNQTNDSSVGKVASRSKMRHPNWFVQEQETMVNHKQQVAVLLEGPEASQLGQSRGTTRSVCIPTSPIKLIQFRPCWKEQLACHAAGVTVTVFNSSYAVWEATGPLPILMHVHEPPVPVNSKTPMDEFAAPLTALIGRQQFETPEDSCILNSCEEPALDANHGTSTTGNGILDYLRRHFQPPTQHQHPNHDGGCSSFLLDDTLQTSINSDPDTTALWHQSQVLLALVRQTLVPAIIRLRHGGHLDVQSRQDPAMVCHPAFNRQQSIVAGSGSSSGMNFLVQSPWSSSMVVRIGRSMVVWWRQLMAARQAWCESVYDRFVHLSRAHRAARIEVILFEVKCVYEILDKHLQEQNRSTSSSSASLSLGNGPNGADNSIKSSLFLLHTSRPLLVDLELFDHLMQAVMNPHLIFLLADYPRLIQYMQGIWDCYFSDRALDMQTDETMFDDPNVLLRLWNAQENARNAFFQIPVLNAKLMKSSVQGAKANSSSAALPSSPPVDLPSAIQLMKQLAVGRQDVADSIRLACQFQKQQESDVLLTAPSWRWRSQLPSHGWRRPFATWHRWIRGDSLFPRATSVGDSFSPPISAAQSSASASTSREESQLEAYKEQDALWLFGVGMGSLLAILVLGGKARNLETPR